MVLFMRMLICALWGRIRLGYAIVSANAIGGMALIRMHNPPVVLTAFGKIMQIASG